MHDLSASLCMCCRMDAESGSLKAELAAKAAELDEARRAADAAAGELAMLQEHAASLQVSIRFKV
jgi:hypothetical protein